MKQFKNYEEARKQAEYSASMKLPAGGYVCKILNVRYEEGKGVSDRITIQFDIAEGEYVDFFNNQYEANTSEDKKWKGKTSIYVPADDGSDRDEWTKKNFARWTAAFESSNSGYLWDWDENKWKGLTVGITFGETGTVINGKEVVYTEARSAEPVEKIRDGSFYKQKFKKKNGYGEQKFTEDANGFMGIPDTVDDSVIPF